MAPSGTDQHPLDLEYYKVLEVEPTATPAEIKKSYRKLALVYHPDKPGGSEATFQKIGEAYQVLSDPERRSTYNKYGKKSAQPEGGLHSVAQFFNQLFGGEKFMDLIGEISTGKDLMGQMEVVLTDEEKEAMEKEAKEVESENAVPAGTANENASKASTPSAPNNGTSASPMTGLNNDTSKLDLGQKESKTAPPDPASQTALASKDAHKQAKSDTAVSSSSGTTASKSAKSASNKLTPEQQQKLEKLQKQQAFERYKRIRVLADKLEEKIRPYCEALSQDIPTAEEAAQASSTEEKLRKKGFTFKPRVKPASKSSNAFSQAAQNSNASIQHWLKKNKQEAEELKMESFGVELLHLIGSIYHLKGSGYIKSAKASPLFLGLPTFWRGVKDASKQVKELGGFLVNAREMKRVMTTLEERQKAGNMSEAEKQALEKDISEKMLVIAWRATRLELNGILREVVDIVIYGDPDPNPPADPEGDKEGTSAGSKEKVQPVRVAPEVSMHRAEAIDLLGGIFRQVVPEAGDEEARHIERIVAEQMDGGKAKAKEAKPSTPA